MQRSYILKEEASSPAVATESLLLSRLIDAKEKCDIMTLDALNIFARQASNIQNLLSISRHTM